MSRDLTYDEMLARAKAFRTEELSEAELRNMAQAMRGLLAEGGVLTFLVWKILEYRDSLKEQMLTNELVTDEAIRIGLGLQGQARGFDQVLALIHEMTRSE